MWYQCQNIYAVHFQCLIVCFHALCEQLIKPSENAFYIWEPDHGPGGGGSLWFRGPDGRFWVVDSRCFIL
ncbi:hypothetical protein B0H10DRAFT_1987647, partial [Mycena sp. CBHHK59/15]